MTACFIADAICAGSRRAGDRRIHQHAVGAEFHGDRGVRRRADACVDDHRHARLFLDDAEVVRILDAEARADRRAQRHHGGRAGVLELAARHRIVVRVGQHDEAFLARARAWRRCRASLSGNSVRSSPITSSLTQLESPASRAEPAPCARRRRPCSSRRCWAAERSSSGRSRRAATPSPLAARSTRRTATVTISTPAARWAACMTRVRGVFAGSDDEPRGERAAGNDERIGHQIQLSARDDGAAAARRRPRTPRSRPRRRREPRCARAARA